MKNVTHPSWIPAPAPNALGAIAPDASAVAEADIGETVAASTPANPWANPLSAFQRPSEKPAATPPATRQHKTRAEEAIAYLLEHGPSDPASLCKAMKIVSKGGVSPFIQNALKDGRIVRVDGKYVVGKDTPAAPVRAQPAPAKDAATEIAAVRRPRSPSTAAAAPQPPAEPVVAEAPARPTAADVSPPDDTSKPRDSQTEHTRTPDFTLTVSDAMLLSWPDGAVTVQRAGSFVELSPAQSKLFCMLVELRK